MKYEITAITDEEYAKADADPHYSPAEYIVTVVECEEYLIYNKVLRGTKMGVYPLGAQYREA